jgi:hypothetical protein
MIQKRIHTVCAFVFWLGGVSAMESLSGGCWNGNECPSDDPCLSNELKWKDGHTNNHMQMGMMMLSAIVSFGLMLLA